MSKLTIAKNIISSNFINENIEIIKIILFGSRSDGNFSSNSDWDFLIIVNNNISRPLKKKLLSKTRMDLIKKNIPADLLIFEKDKFEKESNDIGFIAYYALKTGQLI